MKNPENRLWIISELFPPEETSTSYIMGEIANALVLKYRVGVICGPEVYDLKKTIDENSALRLNSCIEVIRVKAVKEDKNSKFSRIKKFLLISWRLYKTAKKKIKAGDCVLMVTNPFPLIVLMGYLRRSRNFTFNLLVHDIMPEGLYTNINIPVPLLKLIKIIFNKSYTSTDKLISIGRDMNEILLQKCRSSSLKPAIYIIENWGDTENIKPTYSFQNEKIMIQYSGNLGNAQGVGEFVDLMHKADCENVSFGIWGTGSAETSIKEKVNYYGMSDVVSFHGPYFRSQQQIVLNDCDIALVCLVEGMYGLGVPSKAYNILAAGKPILYIGEKHTEIWRMIEENKNGFCFEPSNIEGLTKFLQGLSLDCRESLKQMGQISRKIAVEKYSKDIILNKFVELI